MAALATTLPGPRFRRNYRPAGAVPTGSLNHATAYIEQQLYAEGFSLFVNLINSGGTHGSPEEPYPAFTPPTHILAVAATLVVIPSLTTKASSPDLVEASNEALRFLNLVNQAVGPVTANFADAFTFNSARSTRRERQRHRRSSSSPESDEEVKPFQRFAIANERAVWARAEDFWHIVGWAFNCSVKWKDRWGRWKLWLDMILTVLEDDWVERKAIAEEQQNGELPDHTPLHQSLIARYLEPFESRGQKMRIVKAILAYGEQNALNEFGEVFLNETKPKKKKDVNLKNRKKLNIEEGEFGDYLESDNDDDAGIGPQQTDSKQTSRRQSPTTTVTNHALSTKDGDSTPARETDALPTTGAEVFGGIDSVRLRHRLLALLGKVAETVPSAFVDLDIYHDMLFIPIRPLPVKMFRTVAFNPYLSSSVQRALSTNLLHPLLASSPGSYDPSPTQEDLEADYFPATATTTSFADNAKVAILIESLLFNYLERGELKASPSLFEALQSGREARKKKAWGHERREGEDEAKFLWNHCEKRIACLANMLKLRREKGIDADMDMEDSSCLSPNIPPTP